MTESKQYAGRKLMFWGALALIALAGYECWARLDTLVWAAQGVMRMCIAERIPITRAVSYFDPKMFYLLAFLVLCVVVGLLAIVFRNKPAAGYVFLPLMLMISYVSFRSDGLLATDALKSIDPVKLVPMVAIVVGSIINLIQSFCIYRQRAHDAGGEE